MSKILIILAIFTSFIFTKESFSQEESIDVNVENKSNFYSYESSKYYILLKKLLIKSSKLELTQQQVIKLNYIDEYNLNTIKHYSDEYRSNKLKISLLIRKADFNKYEVNQLIYRNNFLHNQININSINSINRIRNIIGIENYNLLLDSNNTIYKSDLKNIEGIHR